MSIALQQQTTVQGRESPRMSMDPVLLTVYLTLVACGLVAFYSATIANAYDAGDPFVFLRKQIVHILLALAAMMTTAQFSPNTIRRFAPFLLLAGAIMLALVLVPGIGTEINFSQRWISIGGWNVQPSEFAELAFVVFAAHYLAHRRGKLNSLLHDVGPLILLFLVFAVLLLLEPDFGSAFVLAAVVGIMLFLSGMRKTHILLFLALGILSVVLLIMLEPYRLVRWMSFRDPFADPFNTGFQLVQALIAFGRGELLGVGLGESVQKLFYLPYAGSDFLFAIVGEETGFFGVVVLITLYGILIWRIFCVSWLAGGAGDTFSMILAQGIAAMIGIATFINMGVNMGALPTKGLTLPFMSGGGTSLIANSIAIGLVLAISRSVRQEKQQ